MQKRSYLYHNKKISVSSSLTQFQDAYDKQFSKGFYMWLVHYFLKTSSSDDLYRIISPPPFFLIIHSREIDTHYLLRIHYKDESISLAIAETDYANALQDRTIAHGNVFGKENF